jgi:hypothetical protein
LHGKPDTPEFNSVLRSWKAAGTTILLRLVWDGYDLLCGEALDQVDCSKDDRDLERNITELLEPKIQQVMSGFEPFEVQHGPYERESWLGPPTQPPEYDIAFKLRNNPRVMWPLEAKVLKTDGSVAEYVKEIRSNFLTCRYSPFSSEAAMLGYLLSGQSENAFGNIALRGGWVLAEHRDFRERNHRTSDHRRDVPEGKSYPAYFRCHHLVLRLQRK